MSRIVTTIHIRKAVDEVFEYVTTPNSWLAWHPSSVSITGATDHSLEPGEQVDERFVVAGRPGSVTWTVTERRAPTRWVISGRVKGAGKGDIAYSLKAHDGGTLFERAFSYRMSNWLLVLLDWLYIRHRIKAESAQALQRLKHNLESGHPADRGSMQP